MESQPVLALAADQCPWCGSTISRAKFLEIEKKIRAQQEADLTKRLERERRTIQEQADLQAQQAADRAAAAEKKVESLADAHAQRTQELRAEFDEKLRAKDQEISIKVEAEVAKRTAALQVSQQTLEQRLKDAAEREASNRKDAEHALQLRIQEAELRHKEELQEQRELLAKDRDDQLLKKDAEHNRFKEAQQKIVDELKRQLDQRTAKEIGEGAELDLLEELLRAFPDDQISRVPKGVQGPDIIHDVVYKGDVCGRIIFDSKARQGWRDSYVTKLAEDRTRHEADQAILATTVFPKGAREIHIDNGIIIVSPARAVIVAQLLRSFIIRMHTAALTTEERDSKMDELYKYMTSGTYMQQLNDVVGLADEMLELDVSEQKQHTKNWKTRGQLLRKVQTTLQDLDSQLSSIIERKE